MTADWMAPEATPSEAAEIQRPKRVEVVDYTIHLAARGAECVPGISGFDFKNGFVFFFSPARLIACYNTDLVVKIEPDHSTIRHVEQ